MRDIKFRAWHGTHGYSNRFGIGGHPEWEGGLTVPYFSQNCIFEQYTSMHDKNGKEIYEGDIVKYGNDHPNVVVFMECCFCFYIKNNKHVSRLKIFNNINKYEIIGNIHENKELLS